MFEAEVAREELTKLDSQRLTLRLVTTDHKSFEPSSIFTTSPRNPLHQSNLHSDTENFYALIGKSFNSERVDLTNKQSFSTSGLDWEHHPIDFVMILSLTHLD